MVSAMLVLMIPEGHLAQGLALDWGSACGCLSYKQLNPAFGNPIWGPRDPRGNPWQDSKGQLALFVGGVASRWGLGLVSGTGLAPQGAWVLALWSLLALPVLICHSLFKNLQNNSQRLKFARQFLCYFVSLIGDNLLRERPLTSALRNLILVIQIILVFQNPTLVIQNSKLVISSTIFIVGLPKS